MRKTSSKTISAWLELGTKAPTLPVVIARLDRATQYSRDGCDGIEKPRRTGYPACAGYDGSLCREPLQKVMNKAAQQIELVPRHRQRVCAGGRLVRGAGD